MKKSLFFVVAILFSVAAFAQTEAQKDGAVLTFRKNTHDFGTITQGDKVEKVFEFTNTGNKPLIITNIQVTCGCTAPSWPRQPIAAGEKGEITIAFNSTGKMGKQAKVVTVISNAINSDEAVITFTANVVAPGEGNVQ